MSWFILLLAGVFEIAWAIGLKYTEGFTRLWPTLGTVAAMGVSITLLGLAMKSLPLGTAYAIWVGIGAVGTALLGMSVGQHIDWPAPGGKMIKLTLLAIEYQPEAAGDPF